MQPGLTRATAYRLHRTVGLPPGDRCRACRERLVQALEQAGQRRQWQFASQFGAGLGEGHHVQALGFEIGLHAGSLGPARWGSASGRELDSGNNPGMTTAPSRRLILASTSPYRRDLLQRLRLPFDVVAPDTDEHALPGETPAATSERLAVAKAMDVARRHPDAVVIGSDQVADCDGLALGKPHTHRRAVAQLRLMSGRSVWFHTAVAVVCGDLLQGCERVSVTVDVRPLSAEEIESYLRLDRPYDCAGSAKCESLGITLLSRIASDDPTALIGLPLIATARLLRAAGIDPLRDAEVGHGV
jgi:septum formation protein